MTKQEYLDKLQEKLENFGQELQEEILEDYRQHFAEGELQGKSDEEIMEELGNIEDMIQDLPEADLREDAREKEEGRDNSTKFAFEMELDKGVNRVETERTYDYPGRYKAMALEGKSADITILPSEDDQIHIRYRKKGNTVNQRFYEYYQYEEDGVFYAGVKAVKNEDRAKVKATVLGHKIFAYGDMFGFSRTDPCVTLEVKVPAGIPTVKTNTVSGDVCVSKVRLETLRASTVSGDFKMSEADAQNMDMNTASGDIKINGGKMKHCKLNTASGDIILGDTTLDCGNLNSASGDIRVKSGRSEKIKCSSASGDIEISSLSKVCECSAASGDITVKCIGPEVRQTLNTVSGDIALYLEAAEGLQVQVSNMQGDNSIVWDGERCNVKNGMRIFGNGACKASLTSVSGDIAVVGKQ